MRRKFVKFYIELRFSPLREISLKVALKLWFRKLVWDFNNWLNKSEPGRVVVRKGAM